MVDADASAYAVTVTLFVAFVLTGALNQWARGLRKKATCLEASREATSDFYDFAEEIFADENSPDWMREIVGTLMVAVTNDKEGRVALKSLLSVMSQFPDHDNFALRNSKFSSDLENLRKINGELYDKFNDALRMALFSIMFAHGPDLVDVNFELEIAGQQSLLQRLARNLTREFSKRRGGNANRGTMTNFVTPLSTG